MPRQIEILILCSILVVSLVSCVVPDSEADAGPRVVTRLPTDAEVEQHNAMSDPADRIVCRKEAPVGTNIPKRNCWLVRDLQTISDLHRDELRRALR